MQVLIEQKNKEGFYEGFTDNYLKTYIKDECIPGEIYTVYIDGVEKKIVDCEEKIMSQSIIFCCNFWL